MDRLVVVVNVIFTKKLIQTSTYMPASSLYRVLSHYRYPPYSIQTYIHLLLQIPQSWSFSQIEDTY